MSVCWKKRALRLRAGPWPSTGNFSGYRLRLFANRSLDRVRHQAGQTCVRDTQEPCPRHCWDCNSGFAHFGYRMGAGKIPMTRTEPFPCAGTAARKQKTVRAEWVLSPVCLAGQAGEWMHCLLLARWKRLCLTHQRCQHLPDQVASLIPYPADAKHHPGH